MESKLMPCPFCGSDAMEFEDKGNEYGQVNFGISCQKCTASLTDTIYGGAEPTEAEWDSMRRVWNRRSADDHK